MSLLNIDTNEGVYIHEYSSGEYKQIRRQRFIQIGLNIILFSLLAALVVVLFTVTI
jgi:hypothetical protein